MMMTMKRGTRSRKGMVRKMIRREIRKRKVEIMMQAMLKEMGNRSVQEEVQPGQVKVEGGVGDQVEAKMTCCSPRAKQGKDL